jgi:hypothetical protein
MENVMSKQTGTKREILVELMEGVGAMGEHREDKVTLRTHSLPAAIANESPGIKNVDSSLLSENN